MMLSALVPDFVHEKFRNLPFFERALKEHRLARGASRATLLKKKAAIVGELEGATAKYKTEVASSLRGVKKAKEAFRWAGVAHARLERELQSRAHSADMAIRRIDSELIELRDEEAANFVHELESLNVRIGQTSSPGEETAKLVAGVLAVRERANALLVSGAIDFDVEIRKLEKALPAQARTTLEGLRAHDRDPVSWEWLPL
jgi:hypothetical protein